MRIPRGRRGDPVLWRHGPHHGHDGPHLSTSGQHRGGLDKHLMLENAPTRAVGILAVVLSWAQSNPSRSASKRCHPGSPSRRSSG